MKTAIVLLCSACTLLLTSCAYDGPTNEEIINQFKPQFATLRETLRAIADSLPESVDNQPVAEPLSPEPNYGAEAQFGDIGNTDIVMYEQLLDPDIELQQDTQLDLSLSTYLLTYLQWTGPQNPMSSMTLTEMAGNEAIKEFEQVLQMRYLGVGRVVVYEPPVAVSADTFEGGYSEVHGLLVDMTTKEVLCSFGIAANSAESVYYTYKEGEEPRAALVRFAYSTLWENARKAFVEKMGQTCGGRFAIQ